MENNIKMFRRKAGLTQKELSQKSDIPQNRISEYENSDLENITLISIYKIAQALNVTINDIIYPLPEQTYEEYVVDVMMARYADDKRKAENGDLDAIINSGLMR